MMETLVVGGTFNDQGGRCSKIIDSMFGNFPGVTLVNGGFFDDIPAIIGNLVKNFKIVFWLADVPNDKPKDYRDIKRLYPDKIVIHSKRNTDREYPISYLANHALKLKSNLLIEFAKDSKTGRIRGRVLDPLMVEWISFTEDLPLVAEAAMARAHQLAGFTRSASVCLGEAKEVPDMAEFFNIVRDYAEQFHVLINPDKEVTRFLGNASFRCQRGFPSFRYEKYIYVSRRNVDKRYISREGFVAVEPDYKPDTIYYYGDNKPSVDTPIQIRLYKWYPGVNFMVHSHVYISGAPFTSQPVPCGALEEFEEIVALVPDKGASDFCVNLLGHGSLVLARNIDYLKGVQFIPRPTPEHHVFCA
jgi:hypothetical protein